MKKSILRLLCAAFCLLLTLSLTLSLTPRADALTAFDPAELEIPVGGTGTFHLKQAGAPDSEPLQTLKLEGSGRFTLSFSAPGLYDYEIYSPDKLNTRRYSLHCVVVNAGGGKLEIRAVMEAADDEEKYDVAYYPITVSDPPLAKRVTGARPSAPGTFRFLFKAVESSVPDMTELPMPGGSSEQSLTVTLHGEEEKEIGELIFTTPGVYTYEISELNDGLTGYTYDKSVFRVIYEVRVGESGLEVERSFLKDGKPVDLLCFEFTNTYSADKGPGTGDSAQLGLWGGMLILSLLALIPAVRCLRRRAHTA